MNDSLLLFPFPGSEEAVLLSTPKVGQFPAINYVAGGGGCPEEFASFLAEIVAGQQPQESNDSVRIEQPIVAMLAQQEEILHLQEDQATPELSIRGRLTFVSSYHSAHSAMIYPPTLVTQDLPQNLQDGMRAVVVNQELPVEERSSAQLTIAPKTSAASFVALPGSQTGEYIPVAFLPENGMLCREESPWLMMVPFGKLQAVSRGSDSIEAFIPVNTNDITKTITLPPLTGASLSAEEHKLLIPVKLTLTPTLTPTPTPMEVTESFNLPARGTAQADVKLPLSLMSSDASAHPVLRSDATCDSLTKLLIRLEQRFPGVQITSLDAELKLDLEGLNRRLNVDKMNPEAVHTNQKAIIPIGKEVTGDVRETASLFTREQVTPPIRVLTTTQATVALANQAQPSANMEGSTNIKDSNTLQWLHLSDSGISDKHLAGFAGDLGGNQLTGGQNHAANSQESSTIPLEARSAFELPDTNRFRVEFSRVQIESLLKRGEMKLRLHPPELGTMKIELVSTADKVSARFEIASEAARRIVEYNLPQLRENLLRAGIRIDHVEVEVVGDYTESRRHAHHHAGQEQPDPAYEDNSIESNYETITSSAVVTAAGGINLLA